MLGYSMFGRLEELGCLDVRRFGDRKLDVWMFGGPMLEIWMFGISELFGCLDAGMF